MDENWGVASWLWKSPNLQISIINHQSSDINQTVACFSRIPSLGPARNVVVSGKGHGKSPIFWMATGKLSANSRAILTIAISKKTGVDFSSWPWALGLKHASSPGEALWTPPKDLRNNCRAHIGDNVTPGFIHPEAVWIGRYHWSIILSLFGEYPLVHKPCFLNPGLTLPIGLVFFTNQKASSMLSQVGKTVSLKSGAPEMACYANEKLPARRCSSFFFKKMLSWMLWHASVLGIFGMVYDRFMPGNSEKTKHIS